MSRRKHQRHLEEHYGNQLAPWVIGVLGLGTLLVLAIYIGTLPL